MKWRWLIYFSLFVIACAGIFYGWYGWHTKQLMREHHLPPAYENSLKHASAAAHVYSALRFVGIPEISSEELVVTLGRLNERMEKIAKFRKKDTTAEMMKDMANNYVGIVSMQWRAKQTAADDEIDLLIYLAQHDILVLSRDELPVTKDMGPHSVNDAAEWFKTQRASIRAKTEATLTVR